MIQEPSKSFLTDKQVLLINMSSHKHLRLVIEDIYANDDKLTEELLMRLVNELRYSNLLIPAQKEGDALNFVIYEGFDTNLTPLFTDRNEFQKFFRDEDLQLFENSFELYRNLIKNTDVEGYVLNPASEKYLFSGQFILGIKDIPKTDFYSSNPYTESELKCIFEIADNSTLEKFVEDRANAGNYENLFENLSDSTAFALMLSSDDLSDFDDDGIISLLKTGPCAHMYVDRIGGEYMTIFTSKDKLRKVNVNKYRYAQIVNVATLVNFVLSEDMDGIVINPESDNVLIPRAELLKYSLGFEKYANDERLCNSMFYIFPLD